MKKFLTLSLLIYSTFLVAQFSGLTEMKVDVLKNNGSSDIKLEPTGDVILENNTADKILYLNTEKEIKSTSYDFDDVANLTGAQTFTGEKTIADINITGSLESTGRNTVSSTTQASIPCPVMSETQRDLISAVAGDCVFNSDTNSLNTYTGTEWQEAGSGGFGDVFNLYTDPAFTSDQTIDDQISCFNDAVASRSTSQNYGFGIGSLRMGLDFGYRCNHAVLNSLNYPSGSPLTISGYFLTENIAAEVCPVINNAVIEGDCVKAKNINEWTKFSFLKNSVAIDGYAIRCADVILCTDPEQYAFVDAVFMGVDQTRNLQPISEAFYFGDITREGAASCVSTLTGASFANFSNNASCNDLVPSGKLKVNPTNAKGWGFILPKGSKAGTYIVQYKGVLVTAADGRCQYRLNSSERSSTINADARSSNSSTISDKVFEISINETLPSDEEFSLQARRSSSSPTCSITNLDVDANSIATVTYLPDSSTLFGKDFCADPRDCETEFTAQVSSTGVVSNERLDWIDGNCSVLSASFSCDLSISPSEKLICIPSDESTDASNNSHSGRYHITDSTLTTINYGFTRIGGANNGTREVTDHFITCVRQGQDYINAKVRNIVGNFVAKNLRGGVDYGSDVKMIAGYASFGGASDESVCNSSPCTRYRAVGILGKNMSSTRTGLGAYDLVLTGVKPLSPVACQVIGAASTAGASSRRSSNINPIDSLSDSSGDALLKINTSVDETSGNSNIDSYFQVKCEGIAP